MKNTQEQQVDLCNKSFREARIDKFRLRGREAGLDFVKRRHYTQLVASKCKGAKYVERRPIMISAFMQDELELVPR